MRGSKVRAPVSGKGQLCQHSIRKRHGGIELVMECQSCGTGGLNKPDCYRGVIKAIQLQGIPAAIILRSHIEKRHDSRSTKVMGQIAEIINHIDDLQGQLNMDSRRNEKCSGCLKPLISDMDAMKNSLLSRKIQMSLARAEKLGRHNFRNGARCDECAGMTNVQITSIIKMARKLEKEILAGTFNIVEVGK